MIKGPARKHLIEMIKKRIMGLNITKFKLLQTGLGQNSLFGRSDPISVDNPAFKGGFYCGIVASISTIVFALLWSFGFLNLVPSDESSTSGSAQNQDLNQTHNSATSYQEERVLKEAQLILKQMLDKNSNSINTNSVSNLANKIELMNLKQESDIQIPRTSSEEFDSDSSESSSHYDSKSDSFEIKADSSDGNTVTVNMKLSDLFPDNTNINVNDAEKKIAQAIDSLNSDHDMNYNNPFLEHDNDSSSCEALCKASEPVMCGSGSTSTPEEEESFERKIKPRTRTRNTSSYKKWMRPIWEWSECQLRLCSAIVLITLAVLMTCALCALPPESDITDNNIKQSKLKLKV